MHDKHEIERIGFAHTIENEHRFHGEMPRTGTVRRGYDNGKAAHGKRSQRTAQTQRGSGLEAEERQVEMQEITAPNGHRVEDEQAGAVHVSERHDPLPDVAQCVAHLLVPTQQPHQSGNGRNANHRHEPSRCTEAVENSPETGARLFEKRREHAELARHRQQCDAKDKQRVDGALRHHRAQCLRKRNAVFLPQHAAAQKFTTARHHQRGRIRQEHGVDSHRRPRPLAQRLQRLPPAQAAQHLGHDAERQRQEHPRPRHLAPEHLADALEVEVAIHPVQNRTAQHERHRHVQDISSVFSHFQWPIIGFKSQNYENKSENEKILKKIVTLALPQILSLGKIQINLVFLSFNRNFAVVKQVKPKKNLGQHFLCDLDIARRIADTVDACPDIPILEIGPGMGVLTQFLAQKQRELKAVEIDRESVEYLKNSPQFNTQHSTLNILSDDFLRMNLHETFEGRKFVLTGNYPYDISSQIFFKMLDNRELIPCCTGMIQHEVALRMAARPGTKAYGILSVLMQAWYDVEYLFTVEPSVFNPPPKVQSAVIRLTRNSVTSLGCDEELFKRIVKVTFNQRRKMLRVSLRSLLNPDESEQNSTFYHQNSQFLTLRPEQLSIAQFVDLTNKISQTF